MKFQKILAFFLIMICCASFPFSDGICAQNKSRSPVFKKSKKIKQLPRNFLIKKAGTCAKNDSFLVFEEGSKTILEERNPSSRIYPASLVKLMALYLTFEAISKQKISLRQLINISERAQEISFINSVNTLRLTSGNKMSVEEAIKAVIVKSFNEAAVALAEAVAGDEWSFVRMMNKKALSLGMNDTSFRNSSGLHEEGQYSTALDLGRLAYALKKDFPQFYHFFGLKKFTFRGQKFESHNQILMEFKGAEGMKTGFTKASGFNLVSSAKRGGNRIFAVLTGCESVQQRTNLMNYLLELGFYKLRNGVEYKVDEAKLSKIDLSNSYKTRELHEDFYYEEKALF